MYFRGDSGRDSPTKRSDKHNDITRGGKEHLLV